jgi:TniQ
MRTIYISDPEWQETLPHLVGPLPDEWLPGLLLRCDKANDWGSGALVQYLLHSMHCTLSDLNLITPSLTFLEHFAQTLSIPTNAVVETTYRPELARLSGIAYPFFRLDYLLLFCPECIAQQRLLRRTLALPGIKCCTQHHLKLQSWCCCGQKLRFFSPKARPFACPACGLEWRMLPREEATDRDIAHDYRLLSYYMFFFSEGTPHLFFSALDLLRENIRKYRWDKIYPYLRTVTGDRYRKKRVKLGLLVSALLDVYISVNDIRNYAKNNPENLSNGNFLR